MKWNENLVVNEDETRRFLKTMLPELKDDEVFIFMTFARKKYDPSVKDEWMFYRDVIKNDDVEETIKKIKKGCQVVDNYVDLRTGEMVPPQAFVCYIDLSPKSTLKAWNVFSKEMNDRMYQIMKDPTQVVHVRNIKNNLLSAIHRNNSYKPYILIDIDFKNDEILDTVLREINDNYKWISETRGGYHVIIPKTKEMGKTIHTSLFIQKFREEGYLEIKKDIMTPIPGTLQGGFEVKKKIKK